MAADPKPAAPKPQLDVFRNPDSDVGGWWSYADDGVQYLGGDLHRTRAQAEAHARQLVEAARGR